jgi:hypothetical protein
MAGRVRGWEKDLYNQSFFSFCQIYEGNLKIKLFKEFDIMTEKHSNPKKFKCLRMPRVHKRKYEKIDSAEIDLVVQCQDSHEFYKRYREVFPDKKKGIDSISKIWKRRGEFLKKQQPEPESPEFGTGLSPELERLIGAQNKILAEVSLLLKEHLQVTREILEHLPRQIQKPEETQYKQVQPKVPEHKELVKKPGHDKPGDIMIGS